MGIKETGKWERCLNIELAGLGDQLDMEEGRRGPCGIQNDFCISAISVDTIA